MRTLSVLNKLFTTAIIFTMINLNVAINIEQARFNISISQTYAEAPQSGGSSGNDKVRSNDGTVVLENTQESDSKHMTKKRKELSGTYKKEDTDGFFSSKGIKAVNVILLLGLSLIFTKIFVHFQPSKPIDLWAGAAGSAIYLWGEINSAMNANDTLDSAKKRLAYEGLSEDGTVDVSQKQMLEEEKQVLVTAKDAAEKKLKFQRAAAAMFGVTAAYAGIVQAIQTTEMQLCAKTCIPAAKGALAQYLNDTTPGESTLKFEAGEGNIVIMTAGANTCNVSTAVTAGAQNGLACLKYIKSLYRNNGLKLPTGLASNGNQFQLNNKVPFLFALLKTLIKKSHASKASGIALVIGIVGGMLIPADKLIGQWVYSPGLRAIMWTAMGSLALMTSKDTKNQVDALNDNIDKIDSILKKFKSAQSVTKVSMKNLDKKLGRFGSYKPIKLNEETPCVGGLRKIKSNNGTKACPNPEKYLVKASEGLNSAGFTMPGGFTGAMVDATKGLNGVDTISPKTQQAFDVLGKNANAINEKAQKILRKVLGDANKIHKKNGKETNDLLASFGKGLNGLNKKAGGKGGLMSALPYLSQPPKQGDGEASDEAAGQQDGLAAKAKGGSGIGKFKAPKAEKFKFDFGADDAEAYAAQKHAEFDATADAVANMEEKPDGEIIEDKSVDIWKVISVRYKKTAYDRLLKRIE